MKKEFHCWFSPSLGKNMEVNIYGHAGRPMVVFPSSGGSFYEFEDFGMIAAIEDYINDGRLMVFTPASVDKESWLNESAHPADRANRHNQYDSYIIHELVPLIHEMTGRTDIIATGCSMGGYHSMNFYLRHPDVFNAVVALSGCYRLSYLIGDWYCDDNIYFNSPLQYLPNCNDPWFIDLYRKGQIIACCGQGAWEEEMIKDLSALAQIFRDKNIPAWCDFWGYDVNHDWPWWRVQLPYFLNHIL